MALNEFEEKIKILERLREVRAPEIVRYAVIPLPDLILVLFIAFKLAGVGVVSHWGWIWVISPFWISLIIPLIRLVSVKIANFIRKVILKMKNV